MQETRKAAPVIFHHEMALVVIHFGVIPKEVKNYMREYDSTFLLLDTPFHSDLQLSVARPAIKDTPIHLEGMLRLT